jgi:hypothetical protein
VTLSLSSSSQEAHIAIPVYLSPNIRGKEKIHASNDARGAKQPSFQTELGVLAMAKLPICD